MRKSEQWTNWSGNLSCTPDRIVRLEGEVEVQERIGGNRNFDFLVLLVVVSARLLAVGLFSDHVAISASAMRRPRTERHQVRKPYNMDFNNE